MPFLSLTMTALFGVLAMPAATTTGITYHFSSTSTAPLIGSSGGRVWVAGDRRRMELDPDPTNPRPFDVSITAGNKTTLINLQNKTWFLGGKLPAGTRKGESSGLFRMPMMDDRLKGKPTITYADGGAGPRLDPYDTKKHVVHIAYRLVSDIQDMLLRGDVEATVTIITAPALQMRLQSQSIRTGFPEIDTELEKWLSSLEGAIVGSEMVVSRRLEGGEKFTETSTMSIDEFKTGDVDERLFAIPPGLTFQEPQYGVPGT
jgi:hypothetical protein